ncbi:hypothetical protein HMPREF1146_2023 [Prevotella sp. MSX73]|nr:hypothetical protein HMPREF1146_2023 [Prevotella sp. MSX73]
MKMRCQKNKSLILTFSKSFGKTSCLLILLRYIKKVPNIYYLELLIFSDTLLCVLLKC